MLTVRQALDLALSLPATTEQDHHGINSFRVKGRIFATVPDAQHLRVMLGPEEVIAAVTAYPTCCEPFYWGSRLACVVVSLNEASPELLRDLLMEAWCRKAPKSMAHSFIEATDRPSRS